MNTIPYQKISGAGNTFIVVDGGDLPADADLPEFARAACRDDLEHGGGDGLIVIAEAEGISSGNDFEMKYYNRDGSTGMMCGNGGRCAVLFAAEHGYVRDRRNLSFTNAGIPYRAAITDAGVRVSFPDPKFFQLDGSLKIHGRSIPCRYGDVGTPHAVIFIDELVAALGDPELQALDDLDIDAWGAAVRNHPDFAPGGANANFVEVLPQGQGIRLRTFERGVEGETGACGTGAIASAIIAAMLRDLPAPVTVIPTSGSPLRVDFRLQRSDPSAKSYGAKDVTEVALEGGAVVLLEGELNLPQGDHV